MAGDRSESAQAGERYAAALFELAQDGGALDAVAADLDRFDTVLAESEELRALLANPAFAASDKARAITAVAEKAGLSGLASKFLGTLAANRRGSAVGQAITAFRERVAAHRGVLTAEVETARPLTDGELGGVKDALRQALGRDVDVTARVAPEILGGLVVRVGSRMFDSSLRTQIDGLVGAMKGA